MEIQHKNKFWYLEGGTYKCSCEKDDYIDLSHINGIAYKRCWCRPDKMEDTFDKIKQITNDEMDKRRDIYVSDKEFKILSDFLYERYCIPNGMDIIISPFDISFDYQRLSKNKHYIIDVELYNEIIGMMLLEKQYTVNDMYETASLYGSMYRKSIYLYRTKNNSQYTISDYMANIKASYSDTYTALGPNDVNMLNVIKCNRQARVIKYFRPGETARNKLRKELK